jgi:tellurite resistance protein
MASQPSGRALAHFYPAWFALPLGLSGLAMAWHRAVPSMGEQADTLAFVVAGVDAFVYLALLLAAAWRWKLHPAAWADDRRHPVRHAFVAALPIGAILLATLSASLLGPSRVAHALWWAGSLGLVAATLWTLARWWKGVAQGGAQWASVTPALFIPVVGNVLAPLGGVALGEAHWATAQFGIGLLFWPVVLTLLMARGLVQGALPERLLPTAFIVVAPPTVAALSALELGAPLVVGWLGWGAALFCLLWVTTLLKRIHALPFSLAHWGMSFPIAAFAALTLRLAEPGSGLAVLGPALLALSTLVVLGLSLATWRGLRDGSLLGPEAVVSLVPQG